MSRRVSARVKRKTTILQESEQQPASRRRRVEENGEQADQLPGPASLPYAGVDDLIERVTNAVLEKLQNTQFNDNAGTGNVSLPGTASALQGSVVAEPVINELSGSQVNTSEILNSSDQASTAAATVQGSIATVLDSLSGGTSLMSKPKDIFVSSDIPIDMSVSDRLKRKIWAHEYVDFGMLLNNKKDHDSFHLCLSNDMASSNDQPRIVLEPKQKSKHINSIEMWVTAYQIFVGVYTQRYPVEAPFLMKYSEIIRDLAARGYNWRYYDENFRYLRQKDPKAYSWGAVHWELWIRSQPSRNNYSQIKRFEGESKSGFRVPKGYCWKYHKGLKCVGCNFKHSCPLCQKTHQMINCHNFRNFTGRPVAANPTAPNTSKGKPT